MAAAKLDLIALYRTMRRIRRSEETLSALFAAGEIPGFIHLSIGQEAVAAGVMAALEPKDTVASTHRGHGHTLAKGVPLDRFFLELMAKREGLCGGRGGSMHVADLSVGMLGANGIVGAGIPIALGSALAHKLQKRPQIAVAFFGDGALAEGVLHETLNMAALWKAPLLLVCENNGWAEFSPTATQFVGDLQALAKAFGIPARQVDGNDVTAVAAAAREETTAVRKSGPRLLECMTDRVQGHYEGDAQKYRPGDELAGLAARDPLALARQRLLDEGTKENEIAALEKAVEEEIAQALAAARAGTAPTLETALAEVYTQRAEA